MARILTIGIATLDIINTVDHYPAEDAEIRALSQRVSRGGNAANTACVLSQLGHQVDLAAIMINEPDGQRIEAELHASGVGTQHCVRPETGKMPTSYVTLSQSSGSRTIVHIRDCPELDFADFRQIDLSLYDWLHFEGRNITELARMLAFCRETVPEMPVSLEIEKPRDNIESLFKWPDWLLFSRHYAQSRRFEQALDLFKSLPADIKAICGWGEIGSYAFDGNQTHFQAAIPVAQPVDTLGAGDTFNAGVIHSQLASRSIDDTLQFANRLAAAKCQQVGFDNLINKL